MTLRAHLISMVIVAAGLTPSLFYGQSNCITSPADTFIDCGEVDWGFIYTSTSGAYVHPCADPSVDLSAPITLSVQVDTLNCGDVAAPNVVLRITRTFTATANDFVDVGCGLGIICAYQIIDIVDLEPPLFNQFPADTLVSCEGWDLLDYLLSNVFEVDFSDNCSAVEQTITLDTTSGDCSAERQFHWEFSLIDACDNIRIDTHIVSVVDTIGPEISFLPPQIASPTFECKELVVWPLLSAFDMCSQVSLLEWGEALEDSLSCPNHWALSRWAYATDYCGNIDSAQYFIDVLDDVPPTIIYVPLGLSLSCEEPPELEIAVAVDGCLGAVDMMVETDTIFGNCPHNYTIQRTFIATDNCFNEATALQLIVVADFTAPELTIPPDYAFECDDVIPIEDATVFDLCDPNPVIELVTDTLNIQSSGTFTIFRTFTATDACGNSVSEAQIINVEDTTPPYFTDFPADVVVPCGQTYPEDMALFEDGCDPAPLLVNVYTDENFQDCANESVVMRTFVIQDDAGNNHSATQTITFLDDAPPFFTYVPEDYTVGCQEDMVFENPIFDDLCSSNGMSLDIDVQGEYFGCDNNFDQIRIFTITDACGLSASTEIMISVRDTLAPVLTTQLDSLSFYCSFNVPTCEDMLAEMVFTGECDMSEIFTSCEDVLIEGNCEEQACVWERFYYWEDQCGNSDQASHLIYVQESVFSPNMPTGMTPNGDGANDAYVIRDIGPLIVSGEIAPCDWIEDTRIRVLNRWGQTVFETTNYRNDWAGTDDDGHDLPDGTYFVIFEANGVAYSNYVDIRR